MASFTVPLPFASSPPPHIPNLTSLSCSSHNHPSPCTTATIEGQPDDTPPLKFTYSRASPSTRWPHLKLPLISSPLEETPRFDVPEETTPPPPTMPAATAQLETNDHGAHAGLLGGPSRTKVKKMNKLALKRAKDWRERVKYLADRILKLDKNQFVADVLDDRKVQMTPTDFCFVVKWVGRESWQRALEVYEWLNLKHWYSPNPRMLATIIAVLGKANQAALAVEIFTRGETAAGSTVQVYNAMMGVYARNGWFEKARQLLDVMSDRGCEPDLVSFNTLINARLKGSGGMAPGLGVGLLEEMRRSKVRPDIITYNTLISACSRGSNLDEAVSVFDDMERHRCQPDLWTYNAMISVYGRCGMSGKAECMFQELESKGFLADAVTYNSLLYAFAREGNVDKVRGVCEEMVEKGFAKDEMTYNTMIHMYGKQGQCNLALELYRGMKLSGRNPDAVTFTVLIDSLGKACKIAEAANLMSEMLDAGIKPTLRTYSALICGYAKVGNRVGAEKTFDCMLRSGIRPDQLAYTIMLDIFLRSREPKKAMTLYKEMMHDGIKPDLALYEVMLQTFKRESKMEEIGRIIKDVEELCGLNPQAICSVLVKGECYDEAANMLRLAISDNFELDREILLSVLSSFSSSGRHSEALDLLGHLKQRAPRSNQLITELLVVMLCKDHQIEAALREYHSSREFDFSLGGYTMYESLIQCCKENELMAEASQVFSDMRLYGVKPSGPLYQSMVVLYCKMGFPETAHHLLDLAETEGIQMDDISIYIDVIEAYGKLKLWQKAESMVGTLKQRSTVVDRKVWNALIQAYAASGCYERARAVFNTMMRDGPSPTMESMNGLLQSLIVDGRLEELYVVIQELQDMGFKISKTSIILMLDAFTKAGNIFEVKKIYHGMKAAGYFPTMHIYRTMIGLLCRGKRVRDAEAMVSEMEEAGFKPDLSIWNCILKLYTGIDDFRKTAQVYQQIKEDDLKPDEDTYNTLIIMYCRDRKPEEGLSLMHEMRKVGLEPKLDTYKSLISAFGKLQNVEQAEELFKELLSNGCKVDRSFYHSMMKIYRDCGSHHKAENLLSIMKDAGVEPNAATMHLLMVSYGSSGQPQEAEKVLINLKESGVPLATLQYSSVIDAYLKNKDYNIGIQKLMEMKKEGLELDHRIWTCFIRAASLSQHTSEAIVLLNALQDSGFDLPKRLLTEKSESLVAEVDDCLEMLETVEDNAAFNFVNALEDLLWAFELRATASWVFHLAIKRSIYHHDVFRVADKDWGADFRKLSGGAALVGLTLWLDHMQDASLQGYPESPKSVVLITGTAEYNMVSLNSTLKACLWEMGSPFLPCKTRSGLLVAKAHSLRMWLKDSPFCLDLELRNVPYLSESNSMLLIEGCFIRRGLVPAFKEINEKLGFVRPKKFAKLALLSDDKRGKAIQAHIEGGKEKAEKVKSKVEVLRKMKVKNLRRRKYIRQAILSKHGERSESSYTELDSKRVVQHNCI